MGRAGPGQPGVARRPLGLQPGGGAFEQVLADGERLVEGLAEQFLTGEDPGEGHLLAGDDGDPPFGGVGGRRVAVYRRRFEWELDAADACEIDGQSQQVGPVRQRGEGPGEGEREAELVGRVVAFGQLDDDVLECEQDSRVDLEGEVEVEGPVAAFFGVQVDLPRLSQGVRLDEVTFVVDVEAVVDGVVLELGYVSCDVDHRHSCHPNGVGAVVRGLRPVLRRRPHPLRSLGVPAEQKSHSPPETVLAVLHDVVSAVASSLQGLGDWGLAGTRDGQYRSDLVADEAALGVIRRAGFGALSEESGLHDPDRPILVVLDPVDGSTNASRGIPWWATSVCALDPEGPLAAVVANQALGVRFEAVRGGGARRDGTSIAPSGCKSMGKSIVALSGYPRHWLGWSQYRALGAAALDICAVACGQIDAFIDCASRSLAPWDYLGALLICEEAGAHTAEAFGRDLVVRDHGSRRTMVAAATPELLDEAVARRVEMDGRAGPGKTRK